MSTQKLESISEIQRKIMVFIHDIFKENEELHSKIEKIEDTLEKMLIFEKIEMLKTEKAGLLAEIKSIGEQGEFMANNLENEVVSLKKEVKELKKLLKTSNTHV